MKRQNQRIEDERDELLEEGLTASSSSNSEKRRSRIHGKHVALLTETGDVIQFSMKASEIGDHKDFAKVLCGVFHTFSDVHVPVTFASVVAILVRNPSNLHMDSWNDALRSPDKTALMQKIVDNMEEMMIALPGMLSTARIAQQKCYRYSQDFGLCLEAVYYLLLAFYRLDLDPLARGENQTWFRGQFQPRFENASYSEALGTHEARQVHHYISECLAEIFCVWTVTLRFVSIKKKINVFLLMASLIEGRGSRHQTGGWESQGTAAKLYRLLLYKLAGKPLEGQATGSSLVHLSQLLDFVQPVSGVSPSDVPLEDTQIIKRRRLLSHAGRSQEGSSIMSLVAPLDHDETTSTSEEEITPLSSST